MIEKSEKVYINPQENIEEALKAIGETIIDKAKETAEDIEDVKSISIYSSINPDEVVTVDITKNYIAKLNKKA